MKKKKDSNEETPNPDPLRQFFDQVDNILAMVHAKKSQPIKDLPEGIEEKLRQIEKEVQLLCNTNKEIFKDAQPPAEKLPVDDKDKRLLEYAERLEKEVAALQREYTIKATAAKQQEKKQGKAGERERKKKFNQFGGRKDWKPL